MTRGSEEAGSVSASGFSSGSFSEYDGLLNKWDEAERAVLMSELDAACFHLYGLGHDDSEYVLSTFKGIHDAHPLFREHFSQAELVLRKYKEMTFAGSLV